MTLFPAAGFDTESSKMFDWSRPADAEGQPRMAAIAVALLVDEHSPVMTYSTLIKPDGWELDAEAAAVNGLTMERLHDEGIPIADAIDHFMVFHDEAAVLFGFNLNFDTKMLRAELRRLGRPDRFGEKLEACVMRAARPMCGLPKNPTLTEAVRILLGEDHAQAHEAEADMLKTVALYRHLAAEGCIQPKVREGKKA